jgi:YD repeat-containing protein
MNVYQNAPPGDADVSLDKTYSYDFLNRLTGFSHGGQAVQDYTYDGAGLGNRTKTTIHNAAPFADPSAAVDPGAGPLQGGGVIVQFSMGKTGDPDGAQDIVSAEWRFSDGRTSTEQNPRIVVSPIWTTFKGTFTVRDRAGNVATGVATVKLGAQAASR